MPVPKPTDLAEWADGGGALIVVPSTGQKQAGWAPGQEPPAQWFNWWMNIIYTWMLYLNDLANQAWTWTNSHIFQLATVFSAGISTGAAADTQALIVDATVPANFRLLSQTGAFLSGTRSITREYWGHDGSRYWTYNAGFNGTNWVQDDSTQKSVRTWLSGPNHNFLLQSVPSGSGTFSEATWTSNGNYTSLDATNQPKGALLGVQSASGGQAIAGVGLINPGTTVPTFTNSWSAAGGTTVRFYQDGIGIVHLEGDISGGTAGNAAFTLPVGMRPATNQIFDSSNGAGTVNNVTVGSDGTVKPDTTALHRLSGISFAAF